jgi:hypothetical protein
MDRMVRGGSSPLGRTRGPAGGLPSHLGPLGSSIASTRDSREPARDDSVSSTMHHDARLSRALLAIYEVVLDRHAQGVRVALNGGQLGVHRRRLETGKG